MAKTKDVKQALTQTPPTTDLRGLIENSAKELGRALPSHLNPARLVRIALTCIRTNPELTKCTPQSFLGSLFTLAQLGLEPVAGRAYLLPFKNKRKVGNEWQTFSEVQAIVGYKGLVDLFYRHDKAVEINWGVVREKDEFDYAYGTDPFLKHREARSDRGAVIGYYVVAKLASGGRPFKYMTVVDCIEHGQKHSKTFDKQSGRFYDSSPWAKEPDSMCLKTVLIQLAKVLPLSVELQQAIQADETSRDFRPGIEPLDVTPTSSGPIDVETDDEQKDDGHEPEANDNGDIPGEGQEP